MRSDPLIGMHPTARRLSDARPPVSPHLPGVPGKMNSASTLPCFLIFILGPQGGWRYSSIKPFFLFRIRKESLDVRLGGENYLNSHGEPIY